MAIRTFKKPLIETFVTVTDIRKNPLVVTEADVVAVMNRAETSYYAVKPDMFEEMYQLYSKHKAKQTAKQTARNEKAS